MGRNLLQWFGVNEAFLEMERLNVSEIYSAYSQSRRECRLFSRLLFRFIRMG